MMNDIHHRIISSKTFPIRSRSPQNEVPSVNMGYFSLIRYLLQSGGGDARECDHEGRTGLMYCCFIDDDNWAHTLAMILLEYGAKIEDRDQRGLNALHYAIVTQRSVLVRRYLSSLESDLARTLDVHGNSFLHYACSTGNADIVRLILAAMNRYSIDLNLKNHAGSTAHDVARQLNHERCENLLRNELLLHQKQNLQTVKSNGARVMIELLNDRRLSVPTQIRLMGISARRERSIESHPFFIPSSKMFRQRLESITSFNEENRVCSPSKLIDPLESRHMILKRNINLDSSLVDLAKKRADYAPAPFTSRGSVFNSSSSTWRDDFFKMFNQLQTFKTPSYRKTVHPPLNNELSCESFERLYGMGGAGGHDCSNHQPLSALRRSSSQKVANRRSSTSSIKSFVRVKK